MLEFLAALRKKVTIGMVGGSDLDKQKEQLGEDGEPHAACSAAVFSAHVHVRSARYVRLHLPAEWSRCLQKWGANCPAGVCVSACQCVSVGVSWCQCVSVPCVGLWICCVHDVAPAQTFREYLGEDKLKELINYILRYLADVECPVKRCGCTVQHVREPQL